MFFYKLFFNRCIIKINFWCVVWWFIRRVVWWFIERVVCFLSDPIDCENDPCHLAWIVRDNRILLNAIPGAQCSNGTSFMNLNPSTLCSVNIYWYFYTYNWHNDSTILFTRSQKFERFVCPVPNGLFANPSSLFSFYQCSNTIPYKFVNDSNYYI